MKYKISIFQFAMIIGNFLITASLITLPQILTQISEQNAWLIPLVTYPVFLLLVLAFAKKTYTIDRQSKSYKLFKSTVGILLVTIYIRDLRAFIDYISSYLLPTTPTEVIAIVLSLTLLYICLSGIEVIARITEIQFIILAVLILSLPLMLLNEIDLSNIYPIMGLDEVKDLGKSSFFFFPWMGEAVIALYIVSYVTYEKGLRRAVLLGISLGFFLLFILITTSIAVLGDNTVARATYPNIIMIQQINITDFLDRLDLIIVTLWMPTLLSKLALTLYGIHKTLFHLKGEGANLLMTPLSLLLAVLAVVLFKSNTLHLEFTYFTWTVIGIALELFIILLYIILRVKARGKKAEVEAR